MTTTSRRRVLPVAAAVLVAAAWGSAGIASAEVSSFTLSPTAGPPGTVVSVSGHDCEPGSTNSAASDYVAVSAPQLHVNDMQVPVHKNGSWHATFRVPADANVGLAAAVGALCVTDTLPSLNTSYAPQTFTVTAPPATTTTAAPGSTTTPTTPTTKKPNSTTTPTHGGTPSSDDGAGPGSTVPYFGGFPPGTSGGTTQGGTGGTSATAARGAVKAHPTRATRAARAADLSAPGLPAAHIAGASGLGWLAWVLLLALVSAAVAGPLWLRRSRRPDDAAGTIGDQA